ncbi:MAG TPA: hypothetical protein VNQ90_02650 [Chthoniobacteraceae bacterium]|nr:hypothetical protein [Chthoniobacteraceae bacterium]
MVAPGLFPEANYCLEKKQIIHRLPPDFVRRILADFNDRKLDALSAAAHLGVTRSRLYQLRTEFLSNGKSFEPKPSGGARSGLWPAQIHDFLEGFLPLQNPPNYQLVADELQRLCAFKRARSSVEAYVKAHFSHLIPAPLRRKRTYRRFRRARVGELYQHDSSVHQWWPSASKQILLLTVDDHSGFNVAARFVAAETTWNHFCHFRHAFETYGLPDAIYTDGLSLFGPSSSSDHCDPKSQFQRALLGLGVAHLVAPTPQAKGKIERRFGTFQRRLVTLLAHAKTRTWEHADEVLQMEIKRQNRTRQRSTGFIPLDVWEKALSENKARLRATPPSRLLDLHLSLRTTRRVNNDQTIDFEGQNYEISPSDRKSVTIVHHPNRKFWVLDHPPTDVWPFILGAFSL